MDPFEVGDVSLQFRPKDRHVALQDGDGSVVASTGWVVVEAEVAGERFAVLGIGGVIVRTEFRRRGLAREVVEAAIARARAPEARFALLFSRPDRAKLYERLGFREVAGDVLVEQPDGQAVMSLETMWRPLRPGEIWPEGALVVHSLPF